MPAAISVAGISTYKEKMMNNDMLSRLHIEIAAAAAALKQCQDVYRGFKAFRKNQPGLAFCAEQFRQAATALREHAERLATIAEDLHISFVEMQQQLELDDIAMDSRV
jgi:hypothetical protein